MVIPIVLGFADFKTLAKDKRIYYYIGEDYYDFNFVSDGMIVKTTVLNSEIDNAKMFFSDKLFYNTMEIKFRIPNPKANLEDEIGRAHV